ncbi:MAG: DUF2029 domain-containing protein [Gemmatimonadetes bacterium]|nr:DUF2029 domain-containing protein [Gemmatimonadota bacterium]
MTDKRLLRVMLALYLVAVLVATVQRGILGIENNFAIFRWSFFHLVQGVDLYAPAPGQFDDLFKYSPTFALLFAPFAPWPFAVGLTLWNAMNAVGVWYAVTRLLPPRQAAWALGLSFIEVLTTVQRAQSNALCAASIILAFVWLRRGWQARAAAAIALGAFVKIFPLAAIAFALWERRRTRFAAIMVATLLLFGAVPLVATTPARLAAQYRSWVAIERQDARDLESECVHCPQKRYDGGGLYAGVMQQVRIWTGRPMPNWPVQLAGTLILLLPLAVRWKDRDNEDLRRRFLCSMLVYVVIFNHQSESPSFVIAVLGIAIWWAMSPRTPWRTALACLTVFVVSIGYSDAMPEWARQEVFTRYRLKTVPCTIAWIAMQLELLGWIHVDPLPPAPRSVSVEG